MTDVLSKPAAAAVEDAVKPFRIDVPDSILEDLRNRLASARWQREGMESGWDYGVPADYLMPLVGYWRSGYDWREHERRLNALPQFTTTIDGQAIHFIHARSTEPDALPLLLLHGWPGSVAEFVDVIGPLTTPSAHGGPAGTAFHVVIPGLPGFGFSGPTREPGWNATRTARAFAELMRRLGYARFGVQGGDLGAQVARELAYSDPDSVLGIHVNAADAGFIPFGNVDEAELASFSDLERERYARIQRFLNGGNGYFVVNANRPQTIGYALNDSPVGLLAWVTDRMADWVDGPLQAALTADQILTDVMFTWVTGTAGSAARMYYENMHGTADWGRAASPVPVGVAAFATDISIRRYAERANNIVHWTDFDRGGHFAAMEAPDLLVDDVRSFFSVLLHPDGDFLD
jgi:epoxide hydrolase